MTWTEENGFLTREFLLNDFIEAVDFVNKVMPIAEQANHHPDILIHSYKKVKVMLKSHDKNAITEKDHSLAEAIDDVYDLFLKHKSITK